MKGLSKNSKTMYFIGVLVLLFGVFFGISSKMVVNAKTINKAVDTSFTFSGGTITGYTGDKNATEIVVPTMNGATSITAIGDNVFADCKEVTTILIPDTITQLGSGTFSGCEKLSVLAEYAAGEATSGIIMKDVPDQITLPDGLMTIGTGTFSGCKAISQFGLVDTNNYFKVGSINESESCTGEMLLSKDGTILYRFAPAFHYTGNGLYPLPATITEIADYACEVVGLNGGFTIPTSVLKIGNYAFYMCGNLNDIEFSAPSTVQTIGTYAFACNRNLKINLPESVIAIGTYSFAYCSNIQIDISKSAITAIPEYAFFECDNLHTLTTPVTLKSIEAYAFYGCDNFNNIYFLGQTLEKIGTAAFQTCNNLHEIEIPSGVTTIENDTFDGCQNLNRIILPDTVTTIGDNAFKDCQNIHEMVIPESVKYISNSSFTGANQENIDTTKNAYSQKFVKGKLPLKGDSFTVGALKYKVTKSSATKGTVSVCGVASKKLTSGTIEKTVMYKGYTFKITSIASNAFKNCKKLKKITIGANVTTIGKNAFYGAKKLNRIYVKSTKIKSVGKNALKGINKKAVIKVPKKKLSKYKKLFRKSKVGYKSTMKVIK